MVECAGAETYASGVAELYGSIIVMCLHLEQPNAVGQLFRNYNQSEVGSYIKRNERIIPS